MKRWLSAALFSCAASAGLSAWWVESGAPVLAAVSAPAMVEPASRSRGAPPVEPLAAAAPVKVAASATTTAPASTVSEAPGLETVEAQMLMQVMLEQGDPRSPPLGQLKPRPQPSPAVLADPAQYQAFEDRESRALVQAYAGGVQQIPAIRERIEQAAQAGERSAEEIDEARAALEQLELLQRRLQREAPELLPGAP